MSGKKAIKKGILRTNRGIALIALVAIIVMILTIAFSLIYYIFFGAKSPIVEEYVQGEVTQKDQFVVQKIRNQGMDTRIIADITEENVAIPEGFTYVQGDKKTGVIIKSNVTDKQYLFIPYNENVKVEDKEYFKKVDYISMDMFVLNGIKKYNGFFVGLNSQYKMEDLKTINKKSYNLYYKKLQTIFEKNDNVKPHMLYKEEIALVNSYIKENNINLGENTVGIQALIIEPFSQVNINELALLSNETENKKNVGSANSDSSEITKISNIKIDRVSNEGKITAKKDNNGYVCYYKTNSKLYGGSDSSKVKIPIPQGYRYSEVNGVVMIQDEYNEKLIYIWVPLPIDEKDFEKATFAQTIKNKLWSDVYNKLWKYDETSELKKLIDNSTEQYDSDFIESMQKFGGFYISQAEFSYTNYGNGYTQYMNVGRGMVDSSVTNTTLGGNYYRASQFSGNTSEEKYNQMELKTETINEQKKDLVGGVKSTIAHIMYGIEYDATLLWIANTNIDKSYYINNATNYNIYQILCEDSSSVGKYKNNKLGATSSAQDILTLNNIWGLGGNLAEITQEKYNGGYVIRGGSYNDEGATAPIITRKATANLTSNENLNGETIGMRTTLYVSPEISNSYEVEYFEYLPNEDIIEKTDGIEFRLTGNLTRYVNLSDGTSLYEKPNVASKITPLSLAQEVIVTRKALKSITTQNGINMLWARVLVKFSDGSEKVGYINANDLTEKALPYGDPETYFVMLGNEAPRYYEAGLKLYDNPKESNKHMYTKLSGILQIAGKSVDHKWIIYKDGEKMKYVLASQLKTTLETEVNEYGTFFIEKNLNAWTIEEDVKIYSAPNESNSIKTLTYGTKMTVKSSSMDGNWIKVNFDGQEGYVLSSKVTTTELTAEQIAERGAKFTKVNETVYTYSPSDGIVNFRSVCESTDSNTIIKVIPSETQVKRIGIGDNGWSKIEYDGKTGYISNNMLKTEAEYNAIKGESEPEEEPQDSGNDDGFTAVNETVVAYSPSDGIVNMRDVCNTSSSSTIIKVITSGTQVKRVAKGNNGWSKVEYDGKTGYVSNKMLKTVAEYNAIKAENEPEEDDRVTTENETIKINYKPSLGGANRFKVKVDISWKNVTNNELKICVYPHYYKEEPDYKWSEKNKVYRWGEYTNQLGNVYAIGWSDDGSISGETTGIHSELSDYFEEVNKDENLDSIIALDVKSYNTKTGEYAWIDRTYIYCYYSGNKYQMKKISDKEFNNIVKDKKFYPESYGKLADGEELVKSWGYKIKETTTIN